MSRAKARLAKTLIASAYRSVSTTIDGETAWIRLRSPGAAVSLLLDAAAYTVAAALRTTPDPDTESDGPEPEHVTEAKRQSLARKARKDAAINNMEETIDRYIAECVCGVADPTEAGHSPDPNDDAAWDPLFFAELAKRDTEARPWARRAPVSLRRDVYISVLGWIRGTAGEEVAASTATFRPAE